MPITIREILASDTISGAADKINFNFDQLLLNGGGPPGPPGPQGPIGPIGGRGIRGSVWYEGLGDPNLVPPTLTPEDEDNYLRGDGFVWTYNGSTWVNTTISLIGPVGPAGASGKFSEYQGQPGIYSTAGDTTLYPTLMTPPPGVTSGNTSNKFIKAVVIGGLPGNLPGVINPNISPGPEVIASSLATAIVQPQVSLFVHQFDSNGGGIKFHGGNVIVDEFTDILGELTEIRLLRDDALYINVPKTATTPTSVSDVDGIVVTTTHRGQLYQSGKRIQFQTGNSAVSYPFGDTSDFIVDAARNGSGSNPTIQLNVLGNTGAPTAAFRLGSTGTPGLSTQTGDARLGAGLITINGSISITGTSPLITLNGSTSITGTSPLITLNGTQQTNIYAGGTSLPAGVNGRVTIGASSQIVMRTINNAITGAISISTGYGTTGPISITTGNTATGDIVISTWTGNSGNVSVRAATDVIVQAGDAVDISATNEVDVYSKDSDVHIYTLSGSGGDVLIDTDHTGSQIKLETTAGTSPINLTTNGTSSAINLETIGIAPINLTTNSSSSGISIQTIGGSSDIDLSTTGSAINLTGVMGVVLSGSAGVIIGSPGGDVNISASLGNVQLQAPTGVNPTAIGSTNVQIRGSNHIVHTAQLNAALNQHIMLSGTYAGVTAVSGASSIFASSWIRIGNVVTFSGQGTPSAGSALTFNLPIKGPGGGVGGGTATFKDAGSLATCTVGCFGSDFSITDFAGPVNPGVADLAFTFSFTYVLVP